MSSPHRRAATGSNHVAELSKSIQTLEERKAQLQKELGLNRDDQIEGPSSDEMIKKVEASRKALRDRVVQYEGKSAAKDINEYVKHLKIAVEEFLPKLQTCLDKELAPESAPEDTLLGWYIRHPATLASCAATKESIKIGPDSIRMCLLKCIRVFSLLLMEPADPERIKWLRRYMSLAPSGVAGIQALDLYQNATTLTADVPWVKAFWEKKLPARYAIDLHLVQFIYTVDCKACTCKSLVECEEKQAKEDEIEKEHGKAYMKENKIKHRAAPATPVNTAAQGWNAAPWAVVNWALRVLHDPNTEESVRQACADTITCYTPFIERLEEALYFLPSTRKTVFRGVGVPNLAKNYNKGSSVIFAPFSSTSSVGKQALGFMRNSGCFFVFTALDAGLIEPASWYPEQAESLLNTFSRFEVKRKVSSTLLRLIGCLYDVVTGVQVIPGAPPPTSDQIIDAVISEGSQLQFLFENYLKSYVQGQLWSGSVVPDANGVFSGDDGATPATEPLYQFVDAFASATSGPQYCMLLGCAGSGKTAAALAFNSRLTTHHIETVFSMFVYLPSVVDACKKPKALDEHILTLLDLTVDQFKLLQQKRTVVLLLDSLDECQTLEKETLLNGWLMANNPIAASCKVVVSIRDEIFNAFQLPAEDTETVGNVLGAKDKAVVKTVAPFNTADMRSFIVLQALRDESRTMMEASQHIKNIQGLRFKGVNELRLHPVTLSMIVQLSLKNKLDDVRSKIDIYTRYIELTTPEAQRLPLAQIGLEMLKAKSWQIRMSQVHEHLAEDVDCTKLPVRVENQQNPNSFFSFWHKTLAEFFCAMGFAADAVAALKKIGDVPFSKLGPGIVQFFAAMDSSKTDGAVTQLQAFVNSSNAADNTIIVSNAVALLCACGASRVIDIELKDVTIKNANLNNGDFGTSTLENVTFDDCCLENTKFLDCNPQKSSIIVKASCAGEVAEKRFPVLLEDLESYHFAAAISNAESGAKTVAFCNRIVDENAGKKQGGKKKKNKKSKGGGDAHGGVTMWDVRGYFKDHVHVNTDDDDDEKNTNVATKFNKKGYSNGTTACFSPDNSLLYLGIRRYPNDFLTKMVATDGTVLLQSTGVIELPKGDEELSSEDEKKYVRGGGSDDGPDGIGLETKVFGEEMLHMAVDASGEELLVSFNKAKRTIHVFSTSDFTLKKVVKVYRYGEDTKKDALNGGKPEDMEHIIASQSTPGRYYFQHRIDDRLTVGTINTASLRVLDGSAAKIKEKHPDPFRFRILEDDFSARDPPFAVSPSEDFLVTPCDDGKGIMILNTVDFKTLRKFNVNPAQEVLNLAVGQHEQEIVATLKYKHGSSWSDPKSVVLVHCSMKNGGDEGGVVTPLAVRCEADDSAKRIFTSYWTGARDVFVLHHWKYQFFYFYLDHQGSGQGVKAFWLGSEGFECGKDGKKSLVKPTDAWTMLAKNHDDYKEKDNPKLMQRVEAAKSYNVGDLVNQHDDYYDTWKMARVKEKLWDGSMNLCDEGSDEINEESPFTNIPKGLRKMDNLHEYKVGDCVLWKNATGRIAEVNSKTMVTVEPDYQYYKQETVALTEVEPFPTPTWFGYPWQVGELVQQVTSNAKVYPARIVAIDSEHISVRQKGYKKVEKLKVTSANWSLRWGPTGPPTCKKGHELTEESFDKSRNTCNDCTVKIGTGTGLRCETCDYDLCPTCSEMFTGVDEEKQKHHRENIPAVTNKCWKGHESKPINVTYKARCTLCQRNIEKGDAIHLCKECNFHICGKCLHSEGGSEPEPEKKKSEAKKPVASSKPAPSSMMNSMKAKPAGKKTEPPTKCSKGHALGAEESPYNGRCNLCKKAFAKGCAIMRCNPCQYDVCTACAPIVGEVKRQPKEPTGPGVGQKILIAYGGTYYPGSILKVDPGVIRVRYDGYGAGWDTNVKADVLHRSIIPCGCKGHKLSVGSESLSDAKKCGICQNHITAESVRQCSSCKFDLCDKCSPVLPPPTKCDKGHGLTPEGCPYRGACNSCRGSIAKGTPIMRCTECQYDVCASCAPVPEDAAKALAEEAEGKAAEAEKAGGGRKTFINYMGSWYPGKIKSASAGLVEISYDGYGSSWDTTLTGKDIPKIKVCGNVEHTLTSSKNILSAEKKCGLCGSAVAITAKHCMVKQCTACKFDLCDKCGPYVAPPTTCRKKHKLAPEAVSYNGGPGQCDLCGTLIPANTTIMRCGTCQFDVCGACAPVE